MKLTWHLLTIAIAMASKVSAIPAEVERKITITSLSHDDYLVRGTGVPPDPMGAAGPKSIIAVVNTGIQAMDRSGDVKWNAKLVDFFKKLQPDPDNIITDPKIVYDIHSSTFAVVLLEIKCELQISNILLAVSTNSNPSESDWRFQKINAFSNGLWTDYPGFEVDEEAIYITANMYTCKLEIFKYSSLWIVEKKDLSYKTYENFPKNILGTHQPAEVRATTGAGKGIGTYLIGLNNTNYMQSLSIVRINDPTGTVTFDQKDVPIGNIEVKKLEAPQLGSLYTIDAGISGKILDAVWNDDSLWVTSTFQLDGKVTAVWMQVDVSNWAALKVAQSGVITGEEISPNTHTYYPSIAVNKDGIAAFGFSASGYNLYAGAYFTWRHPTDDPGRTRKVETVRAGVAPYYISDGKYNRWGDYSGISVDPADDNCFWVYNQFADNPCNPNGSGCWTTAWAQYCIKSKPAKPTTPPVVFSFSYHIRRRKNDKKSKGKKKYMASKKKNRILQGKDLYLY